MTRDLSFSSMLCDRYDARNWIPSSIYSGRRHHIGHWRVRMMTIEALTHVLEERKHDWSASRVKPDAQRPRRW